MTNYTKLNDDKYLHEETSTGLAEVVSMTELRQKISGCDDILTEVGNQKALLQAALQVGIDNGCV